MNIYLNGEARQVQAADIITLIRELGLERRTIAIERNLEVVPRSCYAETTLSEDDRIEIVHMIGGG